jgi:hypothetical protein
VARVQHHRRRLHAQLVLRERVELHGFHDGHLLGNGHEDEGGAVAVAQQREHAAGVVADRAYWHRRRGDEGDLEEREAVAGRGGVEDDEVPERPVGEAGPRVLEHHDLAEDHQLLEPGRGGEEAVVDRAVEDAAREHLELHDVADVLVHHRGRVQVHREEAGEDLGLAPARGRGAEEARRLDRGRHLDQEHPLAPVPRGHGQGGPHHALSHPALAGEEQHAAGEEGVEEHLARD